MNEKLRDTIEYYISIIRQIFANNTNYELLTDEVYENILNKNNRNVYVNQVALSDAIIELFVNERVKPNYSDDFRYAYIYVYDHVKDTYDKTGQFDKTQYDMEELSFKIIVAALFNNINLKDFNNSKLDGFIDSYANMDIIRKNSVIENNQRMEEELIEENRRANIEKKIKMKEDAKRFIISLAILLGIFLIGNIIINTFRIIVDKLTRNNVVEPATKISEIVTIEKKLTALGYYDYENDVFIRS